MEGFLTELETIGIPRALTAGWRYWPRLLPVDSRLKLRVRAATCGGSRHCNRRALLRISKADEPAPLLKRNTQKTVFHTFFCFSPNIKKR